VNAGKLSKDIDYIIPANAGILLGVGRPSKKIMLTVDGFKMFCMMANTEVCDEIRQWYIKMEKAYKELVFSLASASVVSYDALVNNLETRISDMKAAKKAAKKN
jgi:phage anti-repressor protein